MRITKIVAILIFGLVVIAGGCSSPAPVPPEPVMPTMPDMPPPVPTPVTPVPAPPTPAPPPVTPVTTPPTPPPAVQGPYDIWIPGNSFSPATLTVSPGTKVTWTNKDGNLHTVTSGLFDAYLAYGQSFSYTFTERGIFTIYCKPHEEMSGKIIVE